MLGKCPYCEQIINQVNISEVIGSFTLPGAAPVKVLAFSCTNPQCQKVISFSIQGEPFEQTDPS